jgi:thymidylate synthase
MSTAIPYSNAIRFLQMLSDIMNDGPIVSPRGQNIRELEDYMFTINPMYPCMSFEARKFSLDYTKKEWLWKLSGDRFNKSILEHAKAWNGLADTDGGYNSNYGQYFFGHQQGFMWVLGELMRDKDSRRAMIPLANYTHLRVDNPDHVCTQSISFRIRDNKLNMSVNMRSNDAIWGLTNDAVTFSYLYRHLYAMLLPTYPDLKVGKYTHKADSLHIYERHWEMANKIIEDGIGKYFVVEIPHMDSETSACLIATRGELDEAQIAFVEANNVKGSKFEFYKWLKS